MRVHTSHLGCSLPPSDSVKSINFSKITAPLCKKDLHDLLFNSEAVATAGFELHLPMEKKKACGWDSASWKLYSTRGSSLDFRQMF